MQLLSSRRDSDIGSAKIWSRAALNARRFRSRSFAGEFAAYMTGANLVMEYLLSNAAVARSLTSYAATAVGVLQPDAWRVEIKSLSPAGEYTHHLDFVAVAVVVTLTFCLCFR